MTKQKRSAGYWAEEAKRSKLDLPSASALTSMWARAPIVRPWSAFFVAKSQLATTCEMQSQMRLRGWAPQR